MTKNWIKCKECGNTIGFLDEVHYMELNRFNLVPKICAKCLLKKYDFPLNGDFLEEDP